MDVEETLEIYLKFLGKGYTKSECLKGEELMLIAFKSVQFVSPNNVLLKKTRNGLFEAGVCQIYERLKKRKVVQNEVLWLDWSTTDSSSNRNASAANLHNPELDSSLQGIQGKLTVYLILMGFGVRILACFAEIAINSFECIYY